MRHGTPVQQIVAHRSLQAILNYVPINMKCELICLQVFSIVVTANVLVCLQPTLLVATCARILITAAAMLSTTSMDWATSRLVVTTARRRNGILLVSKPRLCWGGGLTSEEARRELVTADLPNFAPFIRSH